MIVICAGDREYEDIDDVFNTLDWVHEEYGIRELVSGHARGVDKLGEAWATREQVPCKIMPADWAQHDKAAGSIRNREMADYVLKKCGDSDTSGLIAFHKEGSRGTKNMITTAYAKGFDFVLSLRIDT